MTAMGIAGCGGATGGMLFPVIARYTVNSLGISWTLWIMCGVVLVNSLLIQAFAQSKTERGRPASQRQGFVEWRAFLEPSYALYVAAMFFVFAGLWIPYFYVREFTVHALHGENSSSFIVLLILNASGIPGRIIPALLSDYVFGTINTYILILLLGSFTLLSWPYVTSIRSMIPWAVSYGFCAGGISSLLQAGIASLNDEPHKTGIKIGMAFTVVAVSSLLGGPIGGELIKMGESRLGDGTAAYFWLQVFTGSIMLLGCVILVVARCAKTRGRFKQKV
ncbi:MFS general substrate transporter [Dothidotthia symphoricarpi CBS 119687]|uniref:MFS general substrate transporter n=1 Tax=Dothidotthia symphoricarpi CBS 119687 TaxID=1392245 RepID=A0A6A6A923_9PLEO|nr:MFS general substrate transporter [Dothidotthia symphoricarpi CBS 119687]KAF2128046.1 MFS general substrate transporter [Dothidotthia symphoricarpi CBS 119687]